MKKFVCSTILIFAVVLMVAACGSADKKSDGDAVSKSEEAKASESGEPNEGNNESDWITEWIKSESSDEEICAVGIVKTTPYTEGDAVIMATMNARSQLCRLIATGNSFSCSLPATKEKGVRQDQYVDKNGRFSVYVLVCVDRKDLEENKESEKETSETDNTEQTDKTDEDKVVQ
jgi:hypothetical protein